MKTPWLYPAVALALGTVGGFFAGKNTGESASTATSDDADRPAIRSNSSRAATAEEGATRRGSRATSTEDIYRSPGNSSRIQSLINFYSGLTADQLRDEAAKLSELPLNERMTASFLLFARWGELDPFAAMEFSNTMGMGGGFVRPTILQSWASVDPANAARYYSSNPGQFATMGMGRAMGGQDAASIIATEWAKQDPQGALAWANTLPQGKADALASILGEVAKTDPVAASQMLSQLDPADRAEAYPGIASRYGAMDFAAAQAWVRTLPQDEQASAMASAIEGLASRSADQAIQQIAQMPDGDAKNQAVPRIVETIARDNAPKAAALIDSQTDDGVKRDSMRGLMPAFTSQNPAAALAFAQSQQSTPVYDRAMAGYVTSHNNGNPAELMQLAETIEGERERGWALSVSAQRWIQTEPEVARAYIQQSDALSDDMRTRLLDGRGGWGRGRGR